MPDEKWGERVHAVVTRAHGRTPDEIVRVLRDRLAGFKRPRAFEIWSRSAEQPASASCCAARCATQISAAAAMTQ